MRRSVAILPQPQLCNQYSNVSMADTPGKAALFNEIASHVFDKFQTPTEPDTKRRKIQEAPAGTVANASDAGKEPVLLAVKEISVSVPQRKKFELCFTSSFLYARAPGTTTPMPGMIYSWNDIGKLS